MTPRSAERHLAEGPAGPLEVVLNVPAAPRGLALIAHPHPQQGGTLDNKVVQTLAKTFFALDYVAVRFNFRGVGQSAGSFDDGRGETDDAQAALAFAQARHPALDGKPVLAGFSFGSFVATRLATRIEPQRLVLVAPAAGRFGAEPVPADTIVIHGEQDDVVPLADVFDWARPQQLPVVVFPGCGHFFHGRLLQLQQVVTSLW
ncbi:MAG: alpha/beta hydrolase [Bradyrhizobium sp.]